MNNLGRLFLLPVLCGSVSLMAAPKRLSNAVISGDLAQVKTQIQATPEELNQIDKWGWTPLMWAVYYRYLPITEHLLASGADPNLQAANAYSSLAKGATALIIAGYYGLDDQASALVAKGAKVDITDANGKTALDYARQYEFTAVASVLAKGSTGKAAAVPASSSRGADAPASSGKIDLGKGVDGSPLSKAYSRVVVEEFTTTKEIAKDYLESVKECQAGAMAVLTERGGFKKVEKKVDGQALDGSTLLVKVEVTELRITSGAARFWAGPMAGSSYVHARVKLLDGASGKVEREQLLTTENNAWGASWTAGSSDRSIPRDMGAIIAGYVTTVAGGK